MSGRVTVLAVTTAAGLGLVVAVALAFLVGGLLTAEVAPIRAVGCSSAPSKCGYPDETNTGVPVGVKTLRVPQDVKEGSGWTWDPRGWIAVHGTGAVLDGLELSEAHIEVAAPNVTIRNCVIMETGDDWGVALRPGAVDVLIERNTIFSPAAAGPDRLMVAVKDFGGARGVRIVANNIYHVSTGIQVEQGTIEDNYIHDLALNEGDHLNGVTSNGGETALLAITHNTILNSHNQTDAIGLFQDFGVQHNRTVSDNLLGGGGYTIYAGQNPGAPPAEQIRILGNRLSTQYFPTGGHFGYLAAWNPGGRGSLWQGNFWDDTGADASDPTLAADHSWQQTPANAPTSQGSPSR